MSRRSRTEISTKVSLSLPNVMLEEIDILCAANFMTRSSWFLQAAREKLEKERLEKSKNLISHLKDLE
ncbi:hypothetical protein IM40_09855 (plasmid) [Candidatus Paracaedimonas acanthamoebae]|nr:hypothetical protein IM40_09855 [Candidatus Paracaedimonas acanthamoebae]